MKALLALFFALFTISATAADDHAVVLVYHHVSDDTPAATSVSPKVFDQHLSYLEENGFTVWPLGRVLNAVKGAEEIPHNTVAITFDDAYRSVYSEAFARMRQRGWSFTLFVNTESIDRGYKNYLDWDQIRELSAAGVEVANHSHSHAHLVRHLPAESEPQWRARISADIERAAARLKSEIGVSTKLFAYPYGEYTAALKQILQSKGYEGIGQHSGAIGADSDFLALPRFPMATGYADMKRFSLSVQTRPLPMLSTIATKSDSPSNRLDALLLTLGEAAYREHQLACYSASGARLVIERQGEQPLQLLITLPDTQKPGRNKINCTAPAEHEPGAYFWYSYQWLVKNDDGSWYRE